MSREQLEKAETHDDLWNAGQNEMVHLGKMHGFMRMYWAKKVHLCFAHVPVRTDEDSMVQIEFCMLSSYAVLWVSFVVGMQ